jgi:hypothetical protein
VEHDDRPTRVEDQVRTATHGAWLLHLTTWLHLIHWRKGGGMEPFTYVIHPYAGARLPADWKERQVPS